MTPKQEERIRNKISKLKRALAADKRRWGGYYHDGAGHRYLIPELYIKIQDYKGAMTYFRWFDKNFPNDSGYPIFLFEWAITLFKTGHLKQAEKKLLEAAMSNTYMVNTFLGETAIDYGIGMTSNWESPEILSDFHYASTQEYLEDFTQWLKEFIESDRYQKFFKEFISIKQQLRQEPVGPRRSALVKREFSMLDDYHA